MDEARKGRECGIPWVAALGAFIALAIDAARAWSSADWGTVRVGEV